MKRALAYQLVAIGLLLLSALSCSGKSGSNDGGCDGQNSMNNFSQCGLCHEYAKLIAEISSLPPRQHSQQMGRGLVRRDVFGAQPYDQFGFSFPSRGHHEYTDLEVVACQDCHPVSRQGLRHGVTQYPKAALYLSFLPSTDCASNCHNWLPEKGSSEGFISSQGSPLSYTGNFRPYSLLMGSQNSHQALFENGFRTTIDDLSFAIKAIQPGCGGCHNTKEERHGTVSQCLDCHLFGGASGELHQAHLARINNQRVQIDPKNQTESACSYCHGFSEIPTNLKNAACYNCHLSGHQPLAENGEPHFWAVVDR